MSRPSHAEVYESDRMVSDYLLFHYGLPEDILPDGSSPESVGLDFPAQCAALLTRHTPEGFRSRALDLGCAVGRASLELSASFGEVVGIDKSHRFIEAARAMQLAGFLQVARHEEGTCYTPLEVRVPEHARPKNVTFQVGDACQLPASLGRFQAVLAANLICRVEDPAAVLQLLPHIVAPGGTLVICTPCTWMEEFTPREKWLSQENQSTLEGLKSALQPSFELIEVRELPFLIREHARKFQWSHAQSSAWRRRR